MLMKKYSILSLLVVLAVVLSAPPAFAQTKGTVKGICNDSAGNPIAGAQVEWTETDTGYMYTINTNNKGEYFSRGIVPGKYNVKLSKGGKELFQFNGVTVGSDETALDLDLKKEATAAASLPPVQRPTVQGTPKAGSRRSSTQEVYQRAIDLLGKVTWNGREAVAPPGTAGALILLIQRDPNGPYGTWARKALNGMVGSKNVFPDWDGHTGLSGPPQSAAGARHAPAIQRTAVSNNGSVAHPMFVAFSFSSLVYPEFGGDGAWGAAVNQSEQAAMDNSGNNCASMSQRPDWCGTANGGHYPVCRADGKTQWVAMAINNDGKIEDWADGEAIGYDSGESAQQAAVANCNHSGCAVVWSQSVDCGSPSAACGLVSGPRAPWMDSAVVIPADAYSPSRQETVLLTENGVIRQTRMSKTEDFPVCDITTVANFRRDGGGFWTFNIITHAGGAYLLFSSEESGQAAYDYLQSHKGQ